MAAFDRKVTNFQPTVFMRSISTVAERLGFYKEEEIGKLFSYSTRAIITRGLYTFYPLFEVHLCTVTFGLMYG